MNGRCVCVYKTNRVKGATTCSAVLFVLCCVTEENNAFHSDFSPGKGDVMKDRLDCVCCASVNTQRWHTAATRDLLYTSGLAPLTSPVIRIDLAL